MTPSLRTALDDLGLERIVVIYPGQQRYQLTDRIDVVPLAEIGEGCLGAT
jgi:hypothetical protein